MTQNLTFRDLDENADLGDSALDEWYSRIRDTPLFQLDDGDLARACRQQLYSDYVVPIAIERLRLRPLAGDTYDGELLVALKAIKTTFWKKHETEVRQLLAVTSQVIDDELQEDLAELKEKLDAAVM